MNPVDFMVKLYELDSPHCKAEIEDNRPIEHWETHCVNCGVYMGRPHRKDDCPTQTYEATPQSKETEE